MLDGQTKRLGRVEWHTCWEKKVYALTLKAIFFLIVTAAEGRGVNFWHVHCSWPRYYETAWGSKTYSHLFPFDYDQAQNFFPTSRLSPFPVLMIPLLTSFVVASDDAKFAQQARPMERVYEHFVFVRFIRKNKPFAKKEPFRNGQVAISWQGCLLLKFTSQN